ncbi:MAG: nuclear transport factor 2 family protein [Anaerolineales bacterium]|nr:nuclear transport factor 2 family protein [Anaerolineales bacterium]
MKDLLTTLRHLEELLHTPAIRHDPAQLDALLHPDFAEFGRSGTQYNRAQIIAALQQETPLPQIHAANYAVALLAEGVALLTYTSAHVDENGRSHRETLRSSVWVWNGRTWQIRFHQGTPTS